MKAPPPDTEGDLEAGSLTTGNPPPEAQDSTRQEAASREPGQGRPGSRPSIWLRLFLLLLVVALSVTIFLLRDQAEELAVYGYPGVFFLSFLSYATVLLPAPGLSIVFVMGGVFNPIGVALAAGAGAALGELSGYTAGFSGRAAIEKTRIYDQLTRWMKQNGPLTVLILSALPNPLFDLAGIVAGALKMPMKRFLLWCWIGETLKMLMFAYAGSSSFRWILDVFK